MSSLEAIQVLIETNARLTQINREMWEYVHRQEVPNLANYKDLVKTVHELVTILENHPNRDIVHEGSYRYLKDLLLKIKAVDGRLL